MIVDYACLRRKSLLFRLLEIFGIILRPLSYSRFGDNFSQKYITNSPNTGGILQPEAGQLFNNYRYAYRPDRGVSMAISPLFCNFYLHRSSETLYLIHCFFTLFSLFFQFVKGIFHRCTDRFSPSSTW